MNLHFSLFYNPPFIGLPSDSVMFATSCEVVSLVCCFLMTSLSQMVTRFSLLQIDLDTFLNTYFDVDKFADLLNTTSLKVEGYVCDNNSSTALAELLINSKVRHDKKKNLE